MPHKKHHAKEERKPFKLTWWLYLGLAWLISFFLPKPPAVLSSECSECSECSDDEDLEIPSWAVIPAKLQEHTNQISALMQDVELLQKQEKDSVITGGSVDLDTLTILEINLVENRRRQRALEALTQRCDDLIDTLHVNHRL